MTQPLDGVRVLDLSSVVLGPFATQLLGDLGADIVKVEPPDGDILRHVAPMRNKAMGHIFLHHNRNKRSIVLDLKKPEGLAALQKLIKTADVLFYNVRPQAMKRLKLSYEEVAAINPQIIYVGAYGFSQRGPYAAQPAFDDLIQGGLLHPFGVRGPFPVQGETPGRGERTDDDMRQEDAADTPAGGEHRNDLVAPGHLGKRVQQREQQAHWQRQQNEVR